MIKKILFESYLWLFLMIAGCAIVNFIMFYYHCKIVQVYPLYLLIIFWVFGGILLYIREKREKNGRWDYSLMFLTLIVLGLISPGIVDHYVSLKPCHPISFTSIPTNYIEETATWRKGEFTLGYRINTPEYLIVSGNGGLGSRDRGWSYTNSPGQVDDPIQRFKLVIDLVDSAKQQGKEIKFYGSLVYCCDQKTPYYFEGKKVVHLYCAYYDGGEYEIINCPKEKKNEKGI